jgi:hypothetical protein
VGTNLTDGFHAVNDTGLKFVNFFTNQISLIYSDFRPRRKPRLDNLLQPDSAGIELALNTPRRCVLQTEWLDWIEWVVRADEYARAPAPCGVGHVEFVEPDACFGLDGSKRANCV